jgi:hypothetical protein
MIKSRDAYIIASHIHGSFFGNNGNLTPAELFNSGVTRRVGSESSKTSRRIETEGILSEVPVHQTLALDGLGRYHLSTVDLRERGKHTQVVIMPEPSPESPPEHLEALTNSLFMRKLVEIAHARHS